jgi:hypothetical protein
MDYNEYMENLERKLWGRVEKYVPLLGMLPFIRMVAVCNNLAFGSLKEDSDIDLFIVAKKGRLFLVRSMVTFLFQILGVRRHADKVAGRFCLSFFVDDSSVAFESIALKNDIYLAYWIKTLRPIVEENGFSSVFLNFNRWAGLYFDDDASFTIDTSRIVESGPLKRLVRSVLTFLFDSKFGDFVESRLAGWQITRALKKKAGTGEKSSIVVSRHMLKFHNLDRRGQYRDLWFEKYPVERLTDERFLSIQPRF